MRERLLIEIQKDIPIVERPYLYLGERVGADEREVIDRLRQLKEEGMLRHFGPIYDVRSFGYDSALVAFSLPGDLGRHARAVVSYPGVSHCYEREDELNLWFTISVPPDSSLGLEKIVSLLAESTHAQRWGIFRKVRTFKLRVRLDFGSVAERDKDFVLKEEEPVSADEEIRKAVFLTQPSLPLSPEPFGELAKRDGMNVSRILEILKKLKEKGALRRFSAVLNHRKAGFRANALTLWQIPPERVGKAGRFLAGFRSVSHCYERDFRGNFGWRYNLFAMIHGRSREEVISFTERLACDIDPIDFKVLFSGREFAKRRVMVFTEDYYEWERGKR